MSEFAAIAAFVLTIAFVLTLAAAVITAAWQDGSLKADVKFVKRYIAIHFNHMKRTINNH